MNIKITFAFIFQFYCVAETKELGKGSQIHFDKYLQNCAELKNLAISYDNVVLRQSSNNLLISYNINVKRDLSNIQMVMQMDVVKCRKAEAPDTCFKLTTFKTSKVCEFLGSKTESWASLYSCMKPPLECPYKKQVHVGSNCTLNVENFKWFPMDYSYWKFTAKVFNKNDPSEILTCTHTDGYLKKI